MNSIHEIDTLRRMIHSLDAGVPECDEPSFYDSTAIVRISNVVELNEELEAAGRMDDAIKTTIEGIGRCQVVPIHEEDGVVVCCVFVYRGGRGWCAIPGKRMVMRLRVQ